MSDLHYSKKVLSQIKEKTNIIDIIKEDVALNGKEPSFHGCCPFCDSKKLSLAVSSSKQVFECVDCGESGDVMAYIMKSKNMSFNQSIEYLADKAGIELPQPTEYKNIEHERQTILNINKETARFFRSNLLSDTGKDGIDYLKNKRKLDDKTIKKFGLGYATNNSNDLKNALKAKGYTVEEMLSAGVLATKDSSVFDKFKGRVMCPIIDQNNDVIGFSGRLIKEPQNKEYHVAKYLNSPETLVFDKKRTLYGIFIAKNHMENGAVICEGNLDVITLHKEGINNAIAPMGTAFTESHAIVLKSFTDKVHLSFDNDAAGIKATLSAIPTLQKLGFDVDVIDLSPWNDPDEFIKEDGIEKFKERVNNPINPVMFQIKTWFNDCDLKTENGKKEALEIFGKHLEEIPCESLKEYTDTINILFNDSGTPRQGNGSFVGVNINDTANEQSDADIDDDNEEKTVGQLWAENFKFEIER